MARFLVFIFLVCLIGGCGDSSTSTVTSSGTVNAPSPTASLLPLASPSPGGTPTSSPNPGSSPIGPTSAQVTLNLVREVNPRGYPGATQLVRVRARDAQRNLVFGPLERQPGRFTVELPLTATLLELDYVIGETVLGIARIPLNLTGAPVLIDDPDFTDVDKLSSLLVSPANISFAPGGTQQLAVNGTFTDGKVYDLTGSVRYAAASDVAGVTDTGLVTGQRAGATNVTARLSGVTGAANVAVRAATVTSLSVTPANIIVATGATVRYQAQATLSDGTRQEVTDRVSWASSRTDVARFTRDFLEVQAQSPGTAEISATLAGVTGSTSLTVTGPTALRLQIAPVNATIRRLSSVPLTVNATFADGTVKDVTTEVAYSSSAPEVAPVSDAGSVFGAFAGRSTIAAQYGQLSVTTEVTVDDSGIPGPGPTPGPAVVRNSGRFLARALVLPKFPVSGTPVAVVRADFNGDGRADLASANPFAPDVVQVDLNLGSGLFDYTNANTTVYSVGTDPEALTAGDVDGDGDIDVVSVNLLGDSITVLTNNGNGVFTPEASVAVLTRPTGVVVGDFTGDNKPDLAVSVRGGSRVDILERVGGVFTRTSQFATVSARPTGIVGADFNNDGRPDLVTIHAATDDLRIFRNTGAGFTATGSVPFGPGANPRSVATGNFNGDNFPDLVVGLRGTDRLAVLVNDRAGSFVPGPPLAAQQVNAVATGDVNNDGFVDLVAALQGRTVLVALGAGTGFFPPVGTSYPTGTQPSSVAVGDMNGDGKTDVVTADTGDANLSVLQNIGTGSLTPGTVAVPPNPQTAVVADFNLDGKLDTAVANATGAGPTGVVTVLFGQGDGTFAGAPLSLPVGVNPRDLVSADFNGDGRPDLATVNRGTDDVSVLLNLAGGFAGEVRYLVRNGPRGLVAADLDNDGLIDLATANAGSDDLSLLRNTGSGVFALPAGLRSLIPGCNPDPIVAADFNKDGRLDLATGNPGDGSVTVVLNLGGLSFGPPVVMSLGPTTPAGLQAGDYDGDGNLDLGVADEVGVLYFYPGDGAGAFGAPLPVAFPPFLLGFPRALLTPDVDGDGRLDFITVCSRCSFLIVVRNQGSGVFAAPEYYELPKGPHSLARGDLNGDQVPDLVLPSGGDLLQIVLGLKAP